MIIPIAQMRKLRHREIKYLPTWGYRAGKWWNQIGAYAIWLQK